MSTETKIGILLGIIIIAILAVLFIGRQPKEQPPVVVVPAPIPQAQPAPPPEPVAKPLPQPQPEPVVVIPPAPAKPEPQPEPIIPAPPVAAQPRVTQPIPMDEPDIRKPRFHTVAQGDTLSTISQLYYGEDRFVNVIVQANQTLISNPNQLKIGWKLRIPYPDEVTGR